MLPGTRCWPLQLDLCRLSPATLLASQCCLPLNSLQTNSWLIDDDDFHPGLIKLDHLLDFNPHCATDNHHRVLHFAQHTGQQVSNVQCATTDRTACEARSDLQGSHDWRSQADDLIRGLAFHSLHRPGAGVCHPEVLECICCPIALGEAAPGLVREHSMRHICTDSLSTLQHCFRSSYFKLSIAHMKRSFYGKAAC